MTASIILISLIQVFDIVIHVATNQIEPLRITSNIVIMLWLGTIVLGKLRNWQRQLAVSAMSVYLLLNLIFLSMEGLVNSESGEFRTILFILVGLTIVLSIGVTAVRPTQG